MKSELNRMNLHRLYQSLCIWVLVGGVLLVSCSGGLNVKIGPKELKGGGITFLVPTETSSSSQLPGSISYRGQTVKAETNGNSLTINGKDYGKLTKGDVVDIRDVSNILVNGKKRNPVSP